MSERPAAAGSPSTPLHDDSQKEDAARRCRIVSGEAITPRLEASRPIDYRPGLGQNDSGLSTSAKQPPSDAGSSRLEQRPSRSIGMQNILNPTQPEIADCKTRRRNISQLDSPPSTAASAPRYPSTSLPQSPSDSMTSSTPPSRSHYTSAPILGSRHILTPRSPATRAASLGSVSLPSATIDAKQSPFVSSRGQQFATDTGVPNLPPIPAGHTPPPTSRPIYDYSTQPASTPAPPDRQRSVGAGPALSSQSNSPSTSYSSYSQPSRTSPGQQYGLLASSQPPSSAFYPPSYTTSGPPQISLGSDTSYGPVPSSMGQNTYQLMTLDTDQGPIQVPVDVQAASKMADEKRKRNAGASARFRQRRKEKEREASQTIAKLEQRIRDISDESEYYRLERDYFRSVAYNASGQAQLAQRPPSPRQRRQVQIGGTGSTIGTQWQGSEDREGQGRNTRRRTSAYAPPYALPPPPPTANVPNQPSVYSPAPSFHFSNLEARSAGARPLPPPPPPPPGSLGSRTGSYDPSAPPVNDRSWPPGR